MKKKKKNKPAVLEKTDDVLYKNRIVCLFKEINVDTVGHVMKEIMSMDLLNHKPIKMIINSHGGYISAGFALVDIMNQLKSPVYTVITGQGCSMATIIALAGKKRFMTENAQWMGHEMTTGDNSDYYSKAKYRFPHESDVYEKTINSYRKYTKLTEKDISIIAGGELWLNAQQCLKKGIIDKII